MMIFILSTLLLMLENYPCQGKSIEIDRSYKVKKVHGIERRVTQIDFDVNNNTYIIGETTHVYILDPKNEKILNSFNSKFAKTLVTTGNLVYMILKRKDRGWHSYYIHRINLESMELEDSDVNYIYSGDEKYRDASCLDSDGYIYINVGGSFKSPAILKALTPYDRHFLSLSNVDKNFAFNACEEDKNGDLYFMNTELKWGGLVLMPKEDKYLLKGKHIPEVNSRILDFKIWNGNHLYVEDDDGLISVKLLKTGELLPASYGTKYYFFDRIYKQRFYIIEDHNNGAESYLHYITKENLTPVKIAKPFVPSIIKYSKRPIYVEDTNGTAYFAYRETYEDQSLLTLKTTDKEWEYYDFPSGGVSDLAVDNDNIIWILGEKNLNFVNPEDGYPDSITIHDKVWQPDTESLFLKVKKTNEIYIATKNGVFIVSKESPSSKNITES